MSVSCQKDYQIKVVSPIIPTAYWKMDEAAGVNRVNSLGDPNNDLTLIAGADPGGIPGKIGNCLSISQPFETFASVAASNGINYSVTGVGLQMWYWFRVNWVVFGAEARVYLSAFDLTFLTIITQADATAQMQGLTTNSTATIVQAFTSGTWYFAFFQFRNSNRKARLSINAGPWTEAALTADIAGATTIPSRMFFSEIASDATDWVDVDEVGIIVNTLLPDSAVATLYNGGAGKTYPFT